MSLRRTMFVWGSGKKRRILVPFRKLPSNGSGFEKRPPCSVCSITAIFQSDKAVFWPPSMIYREGSAESDEDRKTLIRRRDVGVVLEGGRRPQRD